MISSAQTNWNARADNGETVSRLTRGNWIKIARWNQFVKDLNSLDIDSVSLMCTRARDGTRFESKGQPKQMPRAPNKNNKKIVFPISMSLSMSWAWASISRNAFFVRFIRKSVRHSFTSKRYRMIYNIIISSLPQPLYVSSDDDCESLS